MGVRCSGCAARNLRPLAARCRAAVPLLAGAVLMPPASRAVRLEPRERERILAPHTGRPRRIILEQRPGGALTNFTFCGDHPESHIPVRGLTRRNPSALARLLPGCALEI